MRTKTKRPERGGLRRGETRCFPPTNRFALRRTADDCYEVRDAEPADAAPAGRDAAPAGGWPPADVRTVATAQDEAAAMERVRKLRAAAGELRAAG